jgi:oxygen-dependent protoporphyrinogen oxidase
MMHAHAIRSAPEATTSPRSAFASLQGGMGELVAAVSRAITADIRTGWRVERLERRGRAYEVFPQAGAGGALRTDAVVLTAPPAMAGRLLGPMDPELARELQAIRHVGTATVSLGFSLPPNAGSYTGEGYGFVVPDRQRRALSAGSFVSTKFAGRAPEGCILVRGFLGGEGHETWLGCTDEELVGVVREEFADRLGLVGEPVTRHVSRWPGANPQYDVGHLDRVSVIEDRVHRLSGIYLTGCAYRGVGVPDCIRQAKETAERLCQDVCRRRLDSFPAPQPASAAS